jgi:hypothetical protein
MQTWLVTARVVAVVAQSATILITWPLWTERSFPPAIPLVPMNLPWGIFLLLSLGMVLAKPKVGVPLHIALLVLSIVADQIRLQPYFVAMAIVMIGTLPSLAAQLFARAYLLGLWFFAGLHKLIAFDGFVNHGGFSVISGAFPSLPRDDALAMAACAPVLEIAIASLMFFPRTRRTAVWIAVAFHITIVIMLVAIDHNHSVWPWNAVIVVAAVCFFYPWRESFGEALFRQKWFMRGVVIAAALYPAGYYIDLVEANLAHVLYSPKPSSTVRTKSGETYLLSIKSLNATSAFLPPSHRIHIEVFKITAQPGDLLILRDPRPFATKVRTLSVDEL